MNQNLKYCTFKYNNLQIQGECHYNIKVILHYIVIINYHITNFVIIIYKIKFKITYLLIGFFVK